MSYLKKILLFIIAALAAIFTTTQCSFNKEWSYVFIPNQTESLTQAFFSEITWKTPSKNSKISTPENKEELTLILTREFAVNDLEEFTSILLEYDHRFSTEIYINNKKCLTRHKHLITSENPGKNIDKLDVYKYGNKRVFISKLELEPFLKKGKNSIHIVIANLNEINSFRINKLSLKLIDNETLKSERVFTSTTLPILIVNTNNLTIPDEPKIKATLNIITGNKLNKLSDSSIFHNIKIEVRGNTSQSFAKQSYSFNLYDTNFVKTASSILDLPPSKKWVLQGPYSDKSLIRNPLTYSLYRSMGNYAPQTHFVELIINKNYRGVYVLTEKIQTGKNHLNIPKLIQNANDSTKHTGGYLLELDRSPWRSNYPPKNDTSAIPVAYCVFSPKPHKINTVLEQKIKTQFNTFETHLYNNDNPFNYLDTNSFIDYLIITELTRNTDGYCLSTFLYNKDINNPIPKFYIGPIWDY
ncbi:MAG: CotH kinase family protein, partial [Vicingaceae bacterium]|nr:CotH kinase family protein [Vicingaceae bacterium]